MRIYSNRILPWPRILHVVQNSRIAPGLKWLNYNMYQVKCVEPLRISTNSSLSLLSKNRQYTCYDNYILYPFHMSYSIPKTITLNSDEQTVIYVPHDIRPYDVIVVQKDTLSASVQSVMNNDTYIRFA